MSLRSNLGVRTTLLCGLVLAIAAPAQFVAAHDTGDADCREGVLPTGRTEYCAWSYTSHINGRHEAVLRLPASDARCAGSPPPPGGPDPRPIYCYMFRFSGSGWASIQGGGSIGPTGGNVVTELWVNTYPTAGAECSFLPTNAGCSTPLTDGFALGYPESSCGFLKTTLVASAPLAPRPVDAVDVWCW